MLLHHITYIIVYDNIYINVLNEIHVCKYTYFKSYIIFIKQNIIINHLTKYIMTIR